LIECFCTFQLTCFATVWFPLPTNIRIGNEVILIRVRDEKSSRVLQENTFLWDMPKDIVGLTEPVSVEVQSVEAAADGTVFVTLKSNRLALFVVLTTRAQGRFSENSFALRPMESKVCVEFQPTSY
jgi:hypothetical protein